MRINTLYKFLFKNLDEKILVPDVRNILLFLDFTRSKQHIDIITATKKIRPKTQNANASFDVDIQSIPAECNGLNRGGSTQKKKKTKKNIK